MKALAFGAPKSLIAQVREECPDVEIVSKPLVGVYQSRPSSFLWCFCSLEAEAQRALPALRRLLEDDGMLWLSWPKKTAWSAQGIRPEMGITEDGVRKHALPLGLVDVKVCAVDDTWSGLKLVVRRELRAG